MKKFLSVLMLFVLATPAFGQQRFSDLVGPVGIEPVATGKLHMPYITWGADIADFQSNGSFSETVKGSTFDKLGLSLKLTKGDDFVQQVRDYMGGKSPFLRGTLDMLGQASEVIGSDPRTKPVVFLQKSWSAGDHLVSREHIKTLNDLAKADGKKIKIAVQQGGPHVGLLYKILQAAQVSKDKIEIVWTQDLIGPKGPAEAFRKDPTIDAVCVVTPDMIGLTGGLTSKGSDADGNVLNSHVLVSTQQMSRAIPDVVAVRSDWYAVKENKLIVAKYVAGFLKGCDEVVVLRKEFDGKKLSPKYHSLLTMAQATFGKEFLPTLEIDAHGLLLDTVFVGLTGQVSFFEDTGNLNGFEPNSKAAVDLAVEWGYAKTRAGFMPAGLDYKVIAGLSGLKYEAVAKTQRIDAESVDLFPDSNLDENTILSFNINFDPNQNEFTSDRYGAEFNRAIKSASTFGNAVIQIRGHADPTKTLVDLVKAGLNKGILKRAGEAGKYKYFYEGKELDLSQTDSIVKLIKEGGFDGVNPSPRETMQAALNLSLGRSEAVKKAISDFAMKQGVNLDLSQIQPVGVGVAEPLVSRPKNIEEAKQNMRVEFRIIRISSEFIKNSDFDY